MKITSLIFLCMLFLVSGCSKSKPDPATPVDLATARFLDFQLVETNYVTINITHPQVVNGMETFQGIIEIVVPATVTLQSLTPKPSNFTNTNFTVTPQLGTARDFSVGSVIYTIASKTDPAKQVQYIVTITRDAGTAAQDPGVTRFRFEKSKNPQLTSDVEAEAIVDEFTGFSKIYIFLPEGTDFSSLVPTIGFEGDGLFYSQDALSAPVNSTTAYPAGGMSTDFAYPKPFYLVAKEGNAAKVYSVIADVRSPLGLQDAIVTAPAVPFGNTGNLTALTQLVNRGNHALGLQGITFSNQSPAGSNAVRVMAGFPPGGLLPGASIPVQVGIHAGTHVPGTYRSVAHLAPRLMLEEGANNFLQPASLTVNATITN